MSNKVPLFVCLFVCVIAQLGLNFIVVSFSLKVFSNVLWPPRWNQERGLERCFNWLTWYLVSITYSSVTLPCAIQAILLANFAHITLLLISTGYYCWVGAGSCNCLKGFKYSLKKIRTATYTPAVCKFRGGLSVAQLSSAFPYSSCFPNAADMLPL